MNLTSENSGVIKIANLLAIFLIVCIHYHTRNFPGYFELNFVVQEFIHNVIGRAAVPLFALISGFLFFGTQEFDLNAFWRKLLSRINTILLPCLLVIICTWSYKQFEWYRQSGSGVTPDVKVILNSLLFYPIGSQFWFVRDLLLLVVISPYIYLVINKFNWLFPVLAMLAWGMDFQPFPIFKGKYFIHIEMLSFFSVGAYLSLSKSSVDYFKLLNPSAGVVLSVVFIFFSLAALRIYVEPKFTAWYPSVEHPFPIVTVQKTLIIIGVFLLLVTADYLNRTRIRTILYKLSGFSFFIYLIHDYPLKQILWEYLIELGVSIQWIFYIRLLVALVLMFFFAYILELLFPRFFNWLSGGRNTTLKNMQDEK